MQGREAEAEILWPLPFSPIPIFKGFNHWSQAESADMGTPACGGQHPISEQRSGEWRNRSEGEKRLTAGQSLSKKSEFAALVLYLWQHQ